MVKAIVRRWVETWGDGPGVLLNRLDEKLKGFIDYLYHLYPQFVGCHSYAVVIHYNTLRSQIMQILNIKKLGAIRLCPSLSSWLAPGLSYFIGNSTPN